MMPSTPAITHSTPSGNLHGGRAALWLGAAMVMASCGLGGCGFGARPDVALRSARIVERTDAATLVEMELEASNPSDKALTLRDITYTATSSKGSQTQTRSAQAVLAPFATRMVRLPVAIPADLGEGPFELSMDGRVVYVPQSIVRDTLTDLGAPSPSSAVSGRVQVAPVAAK